MYRNTEERLMIIGTEAFMEFIESIKSEGVKLGKTHIGPTGPAHAKRIEVDLDNANKDIDELDILIPVLEPSFYKDYIKGEYNVKKACITCSKCTKLMRNGLYSGCATFDDYYKDLYERNLK